VFVCVGTNKSSIKLKESPEDGRYKSTGKSRRRRRKRLQVFRQRGELESVGE
jgi:hypothetical protein